MASKALRLREIQKHGFRVPEFCYLHEGDDFPSHFVREHAGKTLIVRSSFGVEDSGESAFAGCFHSEVVTQTEHLVAALKRVLDAIDTPSVQDQILAAGMNPHRCSRGAIVQVFIAGQVSGVAFSHDPAGDALGFTEWEHGGCDRLTSGESKGQRASFTRDGPPTLKPFWRELVRGMRKLAKIFSCPVDAEWSYDGKHLWWLQVRPMTGEGALRALKSRGGAVWSRDNIAERFPDVMTPMGWSLIEETLEHSLRSFEHYTGIQCRNIERASLFERGLAFGNEMYFRYPNCAFRAGALLRLLGRALLGLVRSGWPLERAWIARMAHHAFLKDASQRVLAEWNAQLESHVAKIRNFDTEVRTLVSAQDRINALRALSFDYFKTDLAIHVLKELNVRLVSQALNIPQSDVAHFDENETLMMHQGLRSLCEVLKSNPTANIESLPAYLKFIDHCGHMSEGWDVTSTCLRENKSAVAALIARAMKPSAAKAKDIACVMPVKAGIQALLQDARALCTADEQQHFYAGLYLEKSRQVLASIASKLVGLGHLDAIDDIYYLKAQQLERYLHNPDYSLVPFVKRRRVMWRRYIAAQKTPQNNSSIDLRGLAASGGVAMGTLVFVKGFSDLSELPKDAVLCLKTPNPSFVPWFDQCRAIITENGGVLSHGFIAARELQIPAVSGISFADLKEMEHVVVDGDTGVVKKRDLRRHA